MKRTECVEKYIDTVLLFKKHQNYCVTRLAREGTARLLIGDVAFETARELENCRARCGEGWDGEEHYPILENLRKDFPDG